MTRVATVAGIWRYPVKSMRGEALDGAELTLQGLPHDRKYAFVQARSRSPFPWLTGRELPALLTYRPFLDGAERPRVLVKTPSGGELAVDSDELRAEMEAAHGAPVFLLRDHRGNPDIAQLSLIGLGTTRQLTEESGTEHQPERFRANLYLETEAPFAEHAWVGRVLRIGERARVAVTDTDDRCVMVTLDPETAASRPELLRAVAQNHGNRAGIYAAVIAAGPVRAGDAVTLE